MMKSLKQLVSNKYFLIMAAVFSVAIIIRACFFIGFGLGDDSIYAGVVRNIMNGGFRGLDLNYGMDYRVGLYLPILLFFSIFGINDISFVLYPLLASLGSIIVIYFIGKELFGKETGIIAAILMTFCPFDAVFASTMTIDIMTSLFTALSFLFFLKGHNDKSWKFILYFAFASLAMFYNYMIKIPSVLVLCCFAIITLINIRVFIRHLVFYGSFATLLLASFYTDYLLTGRFLNYWHTELTQSARGFGPYWYTLLEYFRWMFYRLGDGSLLFGYLYHALIPALLYVGVRRLRCSYPVIIWALSIFILLEFIPKQWQLPYEPAPRFPRYTHAFVIPSVLMIAEALYSILKWKTYPFAICIAGLVISSIVEAHVLYKTWAEPFSDNNEASQFVLSLKPDRKIISDGWFYNRFEFDAKYKKPHLIVWDINGKRLQYDIIEKKDFAELEKVKNAYIVVGGSRAVYAAMFSVFNLGTSKPPNNWKLIKEIPKKITSYREETLKIFDVK
ncbi:MAG TPA: ArnT family glycosyltransferase [Candidatus Brocadiia bacterium]|nr:glycosyltransferase family 39 protein [Candidatus Brocadiales bacterium]